MFLKVSKELTRDEKILNAFRMQLPKDVEYNRMVFWGLQGSQNYGLATENSDVDTRLLVMPSFKELALNKQPTSETRVMKDESHLDVKDLRLYVDTLKKQNMNFVEMLFTDYYVVNSLFEDDWMKLVNRREEVARYDRKRTMLSMCGIAKNKMTALERGNTVGFREDLGYDPKQFYQLDRILEFLERYDKDNESYADMMRSARREELLSWKSGVLTFDEMAPLATEMYKNVQKYFYKYDWMKSEPNKELDELFDEVKMGMMKTYLKEVL